ncbi:sodium:calcium antiporter [Ancylomarina euxinus]|uniref:Sodium:calcium antiporter n=1 Tax=Ancylomarina euxinus TaxID=2283627 RepID=A0A425Y6L9_9BACT|nr:sodium:calcium antiporter [Ancylomarina euxinus]MCZ4693983.1 sodium:calcium antiporter [Ancylomarina euxinus]MUP14596.1 sodium:calcium antiporter [Ancylomarina euxinus]RRG24144.1 sodium:calcium antiporter [Ancylomarina euxinus]
MDIFNFIFHTWYGGLSLMIFCSIVIAKSCNSFEVATDYLGRNMSEGVKGASLNAIGSSIPELLTTVFFLLFASHANLARDLAASIGGNTGSAIFNSIAIPMLVIGTVLATVPGVIGLKISKKVILRDGLFLIAAEILLIILLSSKYITHWHGWAFTLFYLVYLAYTMLSMRKNDNPEPQTNEESEDGVYLKYVLKFNKGRKRRSWLLLVGSTLVIAAACAGLVEGCKAISDSLGINPLFVALILIAAASSVPDTIISIRDAKKGNYDDSLANILGSNIFDISISLGLPLALFLLFTGQKIEFTEAGSTLVDIRVVLLIVTLLTIGIFYFSTVLRKRHVVLLGILYILFILYAIGAAEYYTGSESFLAQTAGSFIKYLRQPGGLGEYLQLIANYFTSSW